jgi:hypothetical protein
MKRHSRFVLSQDASSLKAGGEFDYLKVRFARPVFCWVLPRAK